jgi:hypothetical protein
MISSSCDDAYRGAAAGTRNLGHESTEAASLSSVHDDGLGVARSPGGPIAMNCWGMQLLHLLNHNRWTKPGS